jgi:hypothetical protein
MFDAILTGWRAAAGRDGRIDKRTYQRAALRRGAGAGAIVLASNGALVAALVASGEPWATFDGAGAICVWVFGAFATLVLAAMAFWYSPIPETRLLATILVLGPLTLARPFVIAGGLAAAAAHAGGRAWIAAAVAALSMLCLERVLGRAYR